MKETKTIELRGGGTKEVSVDVDCALRTALARAAKQLVRDTEDAMSAAREAHERALSIQAKAADGVPAGSIAMPHQDISASNRAARSAAQVDILLNLNFSAEEPDAQ